MQKFIAACCCAIVGLQVLIAVPLVTCLVVLGTLGDIGGTAVAEVPPQPTYYPAETLPLPISPTGLGGPPGWQATTPVAVAPHRSVDCPPPLCTDGKATPSVSEGPECLPHVEEIVEVRQRLGSPIDESSLYASSEEAKGDSIAELNKVAAADEHPGASPTGVPQADHAVADESAETSPPSGPIRIAPPSSIAPPATVDEHRAPCVMPPAGPPTIAQALEAAAEQLYAKAQTMESEGNYGRADQLRELARAIRREIQSHHAEGSQPPPATVKSASYEQPVTPDAGAVLIGSRRTTRPSLIPARAELVPPMPQQPDFQSITPATVIQEEEEPLLLPTPKSPENPAP